MNKDSGLLWVDNLKESLESERYPIARFFCHDCLSFWTIFKNQYLFIYYYPKNTAVIPLDLLNELPLKVVNDVVLFFKILKAGVTSLLASPIPLPQTKYHGEVNVSVKTKVNLTEICVYIVCEGGGTAYSRIS